MNKVARLHCLGEELNSASLHVLLSEPRHMPIIHLVQAYQSAESLVNLCRYCPLKGNVMGSLFFIREKHYKYGDTHNLAVLWRPVLIFLEARV